MAPIRQNFNIFEKWHDLPKFKFSFEFFPPKTDELEIKLWDSIKKLATLNPHFVSVTYGAGGSTKAKTKETLIRMINETALKPAAHLTCVGATRQEIDEIARGYWDDGVRHIVALRGDPPKGTTKYEPHPEGYAYAADLVKGLKKIGDFEISVAAYPEMHPEAKSLDADIENLKRKIDNGAARAITQFFFDPELYLRFIEKAKKAGIKAPIVPGIVPISNFKQIVKFSGACGTSIPAWLTKLYEQAEDDPETHNIISATLAFEQVKHLLAAGIREFHFYTLNRADLTYAVCQMAGIRRKTL